MYRNIRDAEQACTSSQKIWAGVYPSGSCYFIVASPIEFWQKYMQKNRTYCEIIRPTPCHLFIDIDGGEPAEIWSRLRKDLNKIYHSLGNPLRHVVLTADKPTKKSMHIICKGDKWCLPSPRHGLDFFRLLKASCETFDMETREDDWNYIDTKIYTKNRQFRMLGCTKPGQNRPFIGVPFTYNSWLDTLVQPLESRDSIQVPSTHTSTHTYGSSYVPDIVKDIVKHLNPTRVYHPAFSWIWIAHHKGCRFAGRTHRKNHNYAVVSLERGTITYKCHHCTQRKYTEQLPNAQELKELLYKDITFKI